MEKEIECYSEVSLRSLQEMGMSRKESLRLIMTKNKYVTRFGKKYYGILSEIQELNRKKQEGHHRSSVLMLSSTYST